MKIVLASNNRGKLAELQAMFAPLGVELIRQGELFEGEAPEPYGTFVENALSKARFAAEKTGLPAIGPYRSRPPGPCPPHRHRPAHAQSWV